MKHLAEGRHCSHSRVAALYLQDFRDGGQVSHSAWKAWVKSRLQGRGVRACSPPRSPLRARGGSPPRSPLPGRQSPRSRPVSALRAAGPTNRQAPFKCITLCHTAMAHSTTVLVLAKREVPRNCHIDFTHQCRGTFNNNAWTCELGSTVEVPH